MLQPLLRLVTQRPELLAEHAQAYADLATSEWQSATEAAGRRLRLAAVAVVGLVLGLLLTGVAGLLCAVWPIEQMAHPALLLAIPALPLGCATVAGIAWARLPRQAAFADMRRQLQADLAMLRAAAAGE